MAVKRSFPTSPPTLPRRMLKAMSPGEHAQEQRVDGPVGNTPPKQFESEVRATWAGGGVLAEDFRDFGEAEHDSQSDAPRPRRSDDPTNIEVLRPHVSDEQSPGRGEVQEIEQVVLQVEQ